MARYAKLDDQDNILEVRELEVAPDAELAKKGIRWRLYEIVTPVLTDPATQKLSDATVEVTGTKVTVSRTIVTKTDQDKAEEKARIIAKINSRRAGIMLPAITEKDYDDFQAALALRR